MKKKLMVCRAFFHPLSCDCGRGISFQKRRNRKRWTEYLPANLIESLRIILGYLFDERRSRWWTLFRSIFANVSGDRTHDTRSLLLSQILDIQINFRNPGQYSYLPCFHESDTLLHSNVHSPYRGSTSCRSIFLFFLRRTTRATWAINTGVDNK